MPEYNLNARAEALVRGLVADKDGLGVEVSILPEGSLLVDAGIKCPGSLEAGRRLAEICLGGLGRVELVQLFFGDFWLPGVQVTIQQPALACIASQYAGWAVKGEGFFALGSGPARALAAREGVFQTLGYREKGPVGVLVLETRKVPPGPVVQEVASTCGIDPENLSLLVAPTASLAGSVQVAARVVETGLHKLMELGYDITRVTAAFGTCPLAPVAASDLEAMGRTNDGVLYGGRCFYTVADPGEEITEILPRVPALASRDYGTPFLRLLEQYGDFYGIDPLLFSPAEVIINNTATGVVHQAGRVEPELLKESLLGVAKD